MRPAQRLSRLREWLPPSRKTRALDADESALRYRKSVFHRHFCNASKFCARGVAAREICQRALCRTMFCARRRRGGAAALTHKIKWSHCYFFSAVVIGKQCMSIRDCTAPISPSTQARRAAMAKKRKLKQAAKKTAKKTTVRGRRSSQRRYRSSISHVSEIASHGPAAVSGGSMITQGGPAQVNDRGRRRDGGAGFTIVRGAGGSEEERSVNPDLTRQTASGPKSQDSRRRPRCVWSILPSILPRHHLGAAEPIFGVIFLRR